MKFVRIVFYSEKFPGKMASEETCSGRILQKQQAFFSQDNTLENARRIFVQLPITCLVFQYINLGLNVNLRKFGI